MLVSLPLRTLPNNLHPHFTRGKAHIFQGCRYVVCETCPSLRGRLGTCPAPYEFKFKPPLPLPQSYLDFLCTCLCVLGAHLAVYVDKKGREGLCCWVLVFFLLISKQSLSFWNWRPWKLAHGHLEGGQILRANSKQTLLKENESSWITDQNLICRFPSRKGIQTELL